MKLLLVIATILFSTSAFTQTIPDKLIGNWEAVGQEYRGMGLEIKDSSDIYVVYGDERKKVSNYNTDFSRTPAWFDFSVKDSSQVIELKSIISFINDDLVKWQLFDGATRPDRFTDKQGEMVYLRRKK